MPRAVPTVLAVGHVIGAAVVVGSGTAETVGVEPGGVVLAVEPPQAANAEPNTNRVSASRHFNDTFTPAMVLLRRPFAALRDYAFQDGLVRAR
jgi:hypothetical protein